MADVAEAKVGHNKGPEMPSESELEKYLIAEYKPVLDRAQALLKASDAHLVVTSDQGDANATEFMVKLRACFKWANESRTKEKSPFDDLAGFVHSFFKSRALDQLEAVGGQINAAQTKYKRDVLEAEKKRREETERLAREEERRKAAAAIKAKEEAEEIARKAARARNQDRIDELAEQARQASVAAQEAEREANTAAEQRAAAQEEAAAPAADLTRQRGNRGGTSSLTTFINFRDLDIEKIGQGDKPGILELLPFIKQQHLEQAARDYIKGNKATLERHLKANTQPISGIVFFTDYQNRGRA